MARAFHVFGPTTVYWGATSASDGTAVGQSDGQTLVAIDLVTPHRAITTDGYGGEAADFIQLSSHAKVAITFIDWDTSVLNEMITTITGAAFATIGTVGTVGALTINDSAAGYKGLRIAGTKATANQGGLNLWFKRAFRDPDLPVRLVDIGVDAAKYTLTMRCQPDGSGIIYTENSVT